MTPKGPRPRRRWSPSAIPSSRELRSRVLEQSASFVKTLERRSERTGFRRIKELSALLAGTIGVWGSLGQAAGRLSVELSNGQPSFEASLLGILREQGAKVGLRYD